MQYTFSIESFGWGIRSIDRYIKFDMYHSAISVLERQLKKGRNYVIVSDKEFSGSKRLRYNVLGEWEITLGFRKYRVDLCGDAIFFLFKWKPSTLYIKFVK